MKKFLFFILLIFGKALSQNPEPIQYSPGGLLENVYDHYGNHYTLDDIKIPATTSGGTEARWIDTDCDTGIFRLNYAAGSGFLDSESPQAAARRNVVCKVFKDLSDFIVSPLHNTGNTQKVEIWVRDINTLVTPVNSASTSNIGGMASGFYNIPQSPTATNVNGGIIDNEVWKTIHSGIDSYTNVTPPIISSTSANAGSSIFYHGYVALNFYNTNIHWNLGTTPMLSDEADLYTVILHEVTHALGFASLIDSNGQSKFGSQGNYYTRYDKHLQTFNNAPLLIQPTGTISTLYNYNYSQLLSHLHPNPADCQSNTSTCSTAIRYAGTNTIPVYTSNCFEPASSLSHFEDMCDIINPATTAPGNDLYYTMSNATQSGTTKRFLRTEERNTLCDIGYSLRDTFAGLPTTTTNYAIGNCEGIRVAGINDGISSGSYSFMGAVGNTITIPINGTTIQSGTGNTIQGILRNDFNGITNNIDDIRIEGLQDVYDTNATFNGSISSFSSNTFVTTITYTTNISGVHLLRYVPVVNGVRGNITYVYLYIWGVSNFDQCSNFIPNTCNLVVNGGFESNTGIEPSAYSQINYACGWLSTVPSTPDYFSRFSSEPLLSIPCNFAGVQETAPTASIDNDHYAGVIVLQTSNWFYCETITNQLLTNLNPNTPYRLEFDVSLAENSSHFEHQVQVYLSDSSNSLNPLTNNLAIPFNSSMLFHTPFINNFNDWTHIVIEFTTDSSTNLRYLYIGGFNKPIHDGYPISPAPPISCGTLNYNSHPGRGYYFIDNVSLLEITNNPSVFSINPDTICANTSIANLFTFIEGVPTDGTFRWSLNGGAFTTITGNTFTPTVAGTYTINYTYANNVGCPVTISDTITVNPCNPITPTFTQVEAICSGGSFTLPTTSIEGITGTWSPALNNTATTNYIFTPATGQNATTATMTVTVNALPNAGTVSGNQSICLGGTTTLVSTVSAGIWSSSNTSIATVQGNGLVSSLAVGTANISYTITENNCQSVIVTPITVTECNPCQNDITLSNPESFNAHLYKSASWIETNNNYTILNNQDITMQAGNYIVLKPNTLIQSGSKYWGKIQPCSLDNIVYNGQKNEFNFCFSLDSQTSTNSVFTNYNIGGVPASSGNAYITSTNTPSGITINPNGTITVSSGLPVGTYFFDFDICQIGTTNCLTSQFMTIYVKSTINLSSEFLLYDVNNELCYGNLNLLSNDRDCSGNPLNLAQISISLINSNSAFFTIDSTGNVIVIGTPPAGSYSMQYQVCNSVLLPTQDCGIASVNIDVVNYGCPNKQQNDNYTDTSHKLNDIVIYPNPNKGIFTLYSKNLIKEQIIISVFDLVGKKIAEFKTIDLRDYLINLSSASAGTYLLKIESINENVIKKLVIE